jgi:hypothetical protein
MTMEMRMLASEIYSYLKLWQARKTITMEMRMLASEISFFSLMLLARL